MSLSELIPPENETYLHWLSEASFEVLPDQRLFNQLKDYPAHHRLSVTSRPSQPIESTITFTQELAERGYIPVPHLAAHHFINQDHLEQHIFSLYSSGVDNLFVIAGDNLQKGNFKTSLELLFAIHSTGLHFASIGIGGYPEGHPHISNDVLDAALLEKQSFAELTASDMSIVTQISFDPNQIVTWLEHIRQIGIHLPVTIGIPGTLSLPTLTQVASNIGIANAAHLFTTKPSLFGEIGKQALLGFRPDSLLAELATRIQPDHKVNGIELYSFLALAKTNSWLQSQLQQH